VVDTRNEKLTCTSDSGIFRDLFLFSGTFAGAYDGQRSDNWKFKTAEWQIKDFLISIQLLQSHHLIPLCRQIFAMTHFTFGPLQGC
jgi:hypothetical protein